MVLKISTVSENLPQWLGEAIGLLQKKTEEKKVTAEVVNVQNLPTVQWKNETFYVKFNETSDGATLYNKYANVVRELEHANTIEQVDQVLNEDTVMASVDNDNVRIANLNEDEVVEEPTMEFEDDAEDEDGLSVLASYNEDLDDEEVLEDFEDDEEADDGFEKEIHRIAEDTSNSSTTATTTTTTTTQPSAPTVPSTTATNDANQMSDPNNGQTGTDTNTVQASFEGYVTKKKYNQMVARVNKLEAEMKKLAEYIPAQHAYRAEFEDVDQNIPDLEVQHFTDMRDATKDMIDLEHTMDLTKETGRADLAEHLLNKDDNNECDNAECPCHDDETVAVTVEPMVDADNGIIEIVNLDDIGNFQKQICPCCQAKALKGISKVANFVGIKCDDCDTEYAYDEDTEQLFQKI